MFNFLRRRAVRQEVLCQSNGASGMICSSDRRIIVETPTNDEIRVSVSPEGFRGQRIVVVLNDAERLTTKPPYRDFASAMRAVEGECYADQ